jgi:hypothetical protein
MKKEVFSIQDMQLSAGLLVLVVTVLFSITLSHSFPHSSYPQHQLAKINAIKMSKKRETRIYFESF